MLTFFTAPKPFRGPTGLIQRNALASWRRTHPDSSVLLLGGETNDGDPVHDARLRHVPNVARNDRGTPLLPSLIARAEQANRHSLLCFVNCDIVLLPCFLEAVRSLRVCGPPWLMIGQCRDLALDTPIDFDDAAWASGLRARALRAGKLRSHHAIDYFVFSVGLYHDIPPLAIGRAGVDNWLVWRALHDRARVVDATDRVCAIHQAHAYDHVPGGRQECYEGEEARRNLGFGPPSEIRYGIRDATHVLGPEGLHRNPRRLSRALKRWRRAHGLDRSTLDRYLPRAMRRASANTREAEKTIGDAAAARRARSASGSGG